MPISIKGAKQLTKIHEVNDATLFLGHTGEISGSGPRSIKPAVIRSGILGLDNKYYTVETGVTSSTGLYSGAGNRNNIYRGKCLGSGPKGSMISAAYFAAINDGTFKFTDATTGEVCDMFIGDFWHCTDDDMNYRIAAFDYYQRCGDTSGTSPYVIRNPDGVTTYKMKLNNDPSDVSGYNGRRHHIVLIPDEPMMIGKMNATDITTTGYGASDFRSTTNLNSPFNLLQCSLIDTFGANHLLCHRIYTTSAATNGVPKTSKWYTSICDLPTEVDIFGHFINAAMNSNSILHTKYTVDRTQLPLFRFRPDLIWCGTAYVLQDVVNSECYASVDAHGLATINKASVDIGFRPIFCLVSSNGNT